MPEQTQIAWSSVQSLLHDGYRNLAYTQYLFVGFSENKESASSWLKEMLSLIKFADKAALEEPVEPENSMVNIAFTQNGLSSLGVIQSDIDTFSYEFQKGINSDRASNVLSDIEKNHPKNWSWGGDSCTDSRSKFDAVVIVYASDPEKLKQLTSDISDKISNARHSLVHVINASWQESEPFGYRDGLSNPVMRGSLKQHSPSSIDPGGLVNAGEFIFGHINERGHFPLSPSVARSEAAKQFLPPSNTFSGYSGQARFDIGSNGTYMVIRQLNQDVTAFESFIDQLAPLLNEDQTEDTPAELLREFAKAKLMGRWPDGTSLIDAPTPKKKQLHVRRNTNDFRYSRFDKNGYACPLGSHVRRVLPRDSLGNLTEDKSLKICNRHRILRRGRMFTESRTYKGEEIHNTGVMFVCMNTQISQQFEFIQQRWINNKNFIGAQDEIDPIAGMAEHSTGENYSIPKLPLRQSVPGLTRFVTVAGGAYLFLPGKEALNYLASNMKIPTATRHQACQQ